MRSVGPGTIWPAATYRRMARITDPVVLIVEYEPLIRMIAADAFAEAGFRVFEAEHAAAALAHFRGRAQVHVLFTDVNMPGEMDGIGLAEHVNSVAPEVHLIITSALPIRRSIDHLPATFITKPYDVEAILRHAMARLAA
jgi:CheY-like chemotaxis protein